MSDNSATASRGGIGCLTALGLIFIALKLAEVGQVATWSWWWVLSPFWIQGALLVVVLFVVAAVAILVKAWDR